MDRISPGVAPRIKTIMANRSTELEFDFIEGENRTNSYKNVNVGFGITYVLPVVTALLTAKEGDLIIIENPEAHIHPAGFHDWGKERAHSTVLFAEYHSYPQDDGCDCADGCRPFARRADFVDTLDGAQAAHFSRELVLAGDDGWLP